MRCDDGEVDQALTGECPLTVSRALMWQRWESLTFLHWRYPVDLVQRLVPAELTVEDYDGTAWVGLVPFHMLVSLPRVPALPWIGRFPETNVRTYVRDAAGRPGVWFFSLDAARLAAVATARSMYRLPYAWSSMQVRRQQDVVTYRSRRRWPGAGPSSYVSVRVGDGIAAREVAPVEHFLTARWRVFSRLRAGVGFVEAEHRPWPLRQAALLQLDDQLVTAAGLPQPQGEPLVHFADGVDVRLGPPQRA
jgi:uncharacterized protein YqjF (DUF2071 family)